MGREYPKRQSYGRRDFKPAMQPKREANYKSVWIFLVIAVIAVFAGYHILKHYLDRVKETLVLNKASTAKSTLTVTTTTQINTTHTTSTSNTVNPPVPDTPAKPHFDFYTMLPQIKVPTDDDSATNITKTNVPPPITANTVIPTQPQQAKDVSASTATQTAVAAAKDDLSSVGKETQSDSTVTATVKKASDAGNSDATKDTVTLATTDSSNTKDAADASTISDVDADTTSTASDKLLDSTQQMFYYIQVAAIKNVSDAEQLKAQLHQKGYDAEVKAFAKYGEKWNRILIGPFATVDAANAVQAALENLNFHPIMIKRTDLNH